MSSWSSVSLLSSDRNVALLLGVAVLAVAIAVVSPYPVGVFVDDGYYVILAKALATGHGLRNLQLPGEPYATHFPPGYPLFLSLLWRAAPTFPQNVVIFKLANAGLLGVASAVGYWFAVRRLRLSPPFAVPAVLLGTASIPALVLAGMVLSETLFLTLLVVAVLVAEPTLEAPTLRAAVVVGILGGALGLVRSIGVVAPLAVAMLLWRRAGWRHAVTAGAASLALLVPWQLWAATHQTAELRDLAGSFGSYASWLAQGYRDLGWSGLRAVAAENLQALDVNLGDMVAPVLPLAIKSVVLALAVGVWATGAWSAARRAPVLVGVVIAYVGVVIVFPFGPLRFIWGIWLLIAMVFAAGVSVIWGWRTRSRVEAGVRWAGLAACGAVIAGNLFYNVRAYRDHWWDSIPRGQAERAAPLLRWAVANTSPNDLLVGEGDNMQYLYAGRRALPPYSFTAAQYVQPPTDAMRAETLGHILASPGVTYLVTGDAAILRAAALVPGSRVRLVPVAKLHGGGVAFRVEHTPGDAPGRVER